jgi:hypothetical protein
MGPGMIGPGLPGQPRPPILAAPADTSLYVRGVSAPSGQPSPAPGAALLVAVGPLAVPCG